MKRVLKGAGLVVLLLVIAVASIGYAVFGDISPIVDGQQVVSGVEAVKDGYVSVFLVDEHLGIVHANRAGTEMLIRDIIRDDHKEIQIAVRTRVTPRF